MTLISCQDCRYSTKVARTTMCNHTARSTNKAYDERHTGHCGLTADLFEKEPSAREVVSCKDCREFKPSNATCNRSTQFARVDIERVRSDLRSCGPDGRFFMARTPETPSSSPSCLYCRHREPVGIEVRAQCLRPDNPIQYFTDATRVNGKACGPNGKHFEPRTPVQTSALPLAPESCRDAVEGLASL